MTTLTEIFTSEDTGGLDEDELGMLVVHLVEIHDLSPYDVAQCLPRRSRWVRETYREYKDEDSETVGNSEGSE
ncbi:hypothetical protein [Haloarcula sp. JP-L23]|uniref:hypothetical protein n=1 Tax=Haloarcula sp. JP-L23 TaxID=2716717 RepID=UPI00140EE30B|nr:hypothetical protein G9465_12275 [Haloarcula sp. JP-L23]